MQELRSRGALDISKVEYAVLETDGRLNVILYPAEQPVTASQLQLQVPDSGYPVSVVSDGRILSENLKRCGKDEAWLTQELQSRRIRSAREVFLMTVNAAGEIYLARKEKA